MEYKSEKKSASSFEHYCNTDYIHTCTHARAHAYIHTYNTQLYQIFSWLHIKYRYIIVTEYHHLPGLLALGSQLNMMTATFSS